MPAWPAWLSWALAAAGFSLLAYGLLRLGRAVLLPGAGRVEVSLLLVVKNRQDMIEGAVRELTNRYGWLRDGPGYEIVVVDDGSTDDTPAILDRLARDSAGFVRVVRPATIRAPLDCGLAVCRGRTAIITNLDSLLLKQKEMGFRRRTSAGTGALGFRRECQD